MLKNSLLDYESYLLQAKELAGRYDIIRYEKMGKSKEDREIFGLFYGAGEKTIICCGGVHGRENVNPYVLLQMLKEYAEKKKIFDGYKLLMIPLLNPDGYEKARTVPEWKNNGNNIDINRNFPSVHYKLERDGEYAGSEMETQILINQIKKYPDGAFLDFHSRGEIIYYYRTAMDEKYNKTQLLLAKELEKVTGYTIGNEQDDLDDRLSGGNTVHFYSEYTKNPAITIETVPEIIQFPISPIWQKIVYEQTKNVPETVIRFLENLDI